MSAGILAASPNEEVRLFPLADGGEGTVDILHWHLGGEKIAIQAHDPLFRPVGARFFLFPHQGGGKVAFLEMAQASGLQLLSAEERNPLKTSTFGTGELVLEAIRRGATELYLAIGGSATNDAGMGMAAAMGWRFLDENGVGLRPIGENLGHVAKVQAPSTNLVLPVVHVLCDVDNPLFGPNGAAQVFAPQKGANKEAVQRLDEGLRHFSELVSLAIGRDFAQQKGAGAAGGLGFGAMAFLGATMAPGADTVMQLTGFEEVATQMDWIITGEGKLDAQTGSGKLVSRLAATARKLGVPVGAICGNIVASEKDLQALGLSFAIQLKKTREPLSRSIAQTAERLREAAYNVLKTMQL